jgi:endonuclease G
MREIASSVVSHFGEVDAGNDVLMIELAGYFDRSAAAIAIGAGISESEVEELRKILIGGKRSLAIYLDSLRLDLETVSGSEEGKIMSKIDVYLIDLFETLEEEIEHGTTEGSASSDAALLPMLVRVNDTSWDPNKIPDCQVAFRVQDIIGCIGTMRTVQALDEDQSVISVEASRPGSAWDSSPTTSSLSCIQADQIHQTIHERGNEALIAIIDNGIDVLHEAFLDSTGTKTRILAIWDQTDETGPGHEFADNILQIGTEHKEEQINEYIQTKTVPPGLRNFGLHKNDGTREGGHGTHVASIAAGRAGKHFPGGVAPEAKLIVVIPKLEGSMGYSFPHVMALEYIHRYAKREKKSVVVNVSQGLNLGAHDGTSPFELAFDRISGGGRDPGFVIVKSAGNERNWQNHAKFRVAQDGSEHLDWSSEGKVWRQKDVVELWFSASNALRFCLISPHGEKSPWITQGAVQKGEFLSGNDYTISYKRYHEDNGDSYLSVIVKKGSAAFIDQGKWRLEIESVHIEAGEEYIHAWIERDSKRAVKFTNHLNEEVTLSIPGTARTVISVGAVNMSKPFSNPDYSSYGPTRDMRYKPDLAAPGERIVGAYSGSDTYDEVCEMGGTSMAAPHVTGAIALLLSARVKQCQKHPELEQLNAVQIQSALRQTTQNHSGQWHNGMGYGVLDIWKLFKEFGLDNA